MAGFLEAGKRPLTQEEAEWVERAREASLGNITVIGQLADMLITLNELAGVEDLDPYYKKELCRDGIETVAYGIKELARAAADRQEFIQDTLVGITAAEMQGRQELVRKAYSVNREVDENLKSSRAENDLHQAVNGQPLFTPEVVV